MNLELLKAWLMKHLKLQIVDLISQEYQFHGGSGRLTPVSYGNAGNVANAYLPYSIPSGKYPIFDFNIDSYRVWLTNNLYNIKMRSL